MRWVLGIVGGYIALVIALLVAFPYIAHAAQREQNRFFDHHGHTMVVTEDAPLPFVPRSITVSIYGRTGVLLDDQAFKGAYWAWPNRWTDTNVEITIYRLDLHDRSKPQSVPSTVTMNLEQ